MANVLKHEKQEEIRALGRLGWSLRRIEEAMFAEERPHLRALPAEPFRYYHFSKRTVHLDGCIEVEAAYYGAPPGWIGREVLVQWDGAVVRLLDPANGALLREHRHRPRGWRQVQASDLPERTPTSTLKLLARARAAGAAVGKLCEEIHGRREEAGVRRILGILSLVKRHGASSVERAAQCALDVGVPEYRFVKKWIERHPVAPLSLRQVDPLIRELSLYRDLVSQLTSAREHS